MSDERIGLLKKALDALSLAAAAVGELDEYEIPGSFGDPLDTDRIIAGLAEVAGDLRDAKQTLEDQEEETSGIEEFDWEGVDEEEDEEDDDWAEEDDDSDELDWIDGLEPYESEDEGIDTNWGEED